MVRARIKSPVVMPAFIGHDLVRDLLDPLSLIKALENAFSHGVDAPERTHVSMESGDAAPDTLLMMPAWNSAYLGIKLATIHPGNSERQLPSVHASYVLKNRITGRDLALIDGESLTQLRTAATSALASSILSRQDASTLLMVGAGSLSLPLIEAHCAVRPIDRIMIWNRSHDRADSVATRSRLPIEIVDDLIKATSEADIISCATLSTHPLIEGHVVRPGTHVDLVGAYRPDMRESDATLIQQSMVFVDTYEGARSEAGDLLLAAEDSDWTFNAIQADLAALCRNEHAGRNSEEEITLFKSVGASLEDLAAAILIWERHLARLDPKIPT